MRIRRILACICASTIGVVAGIPVAYAERFTVRAAIEWTHFTSVNAAAADDPAVLESPNGRYSVFMTSRGDVDQNVVLSQLFIVDMADMERESLQNFKHVSAPRMMAEFRYRRAWEAPSDVRWLDAETLGFVYHDEVGTAQGFALDVRTGQRKQLTNSRSDVTAFAVTPRGVIYWAIEPRSAAGFVNADGRTLSALFDPNPEIEQEIPIVGLYTETPGGVRERLLTQRVRLRRDFMTIWPSPDGASAVVLMPAVDAPSYWYQYSFPLPTWFAYHPSIAVSDPTSFDLFLRPRYYVVDVDDRSAAPLVDAPDGYLSLNGTRHQVFWTRLHDRVIASNTFLPLSNSAGAEARERRDHPYVAEFDLTAGTIHPILTEPSRATTVGLPRAPAEWSLTQIDYDEGRLTAEISSENGQSWRNHYRRQSNGDWKLMSIDPNTGSALTKLSVRQSLNDPPRLVARNTPCQCEAVMYDPNPSSHRYSFGTNSEFSWTSGGRMWTAGLILPTDYVQGRRYPLIIQTHGFDAGEFLVDGPSGYTTAFAAQSFANSGFVVLQVGGILAIEVAPTEEDGIYANAFADAVEVLTQRGLVDAARVGAIGFSRTGTYVVAASLRYPSLFAAVSLSDSGIQGYIGQLLQVNNNRDLRVQVRDSIGMDHGEADPQVWFEQSPISRVAKLRPPVRLEAMSPDSAVVNWEMYAILRSNRRPVDFYYFPNGSHVLTEPRQRLASQGGNLEWFQFWLQNEEDSAPDKREQYVRWRAMRDQAIAN